MSGVNALIIDSVLFSRRRWDGGVYCDLGQVKVGMSSSHLLQAILEPFAVVDVTRIKEGLGNAKLRNNVNFGLLHLFTKRGQFCSQIGFHLLCFFEPTGLFRKHFNLSRELLVKVRIASEYWAPFLFSISWHLWNCQITPSLAMHLSWKAFMCTNAWDKAWRLK